MMRMKWTMAFCLIGLAGGGLTRGAEDRFPLVMPGDDAMATATDMSRFNARPAGADGFVAIRDGHFATAAGRLRIWGVNVCFSAVFPEHADAEKVAARFAKLGINGVRMHHHDSANAPRGLWDGYENGHRKISPEMLDRQDYFLDQLHRRGIYANLNLHVGRTFTEAEGFVSKDLPRDFRYDKFLLYFDPRMREHFKAFCREYLEHVNPYRKLRRTDDPGIAVIEITNENSFHTKVAQLACKLQDPYRSEFQRQWNAWLKSQHTDDAALRRAWGGRDEPAGPVLIDGLTGEADLAHWKLHRHGTSYVPVFGQADPDGGHNAVKLDIREPAAAQHGQELLADGLSVEKDALYTLSFAVRADAERELYVDLSRSGPDNWGAVGYRQTLQIGPRWQRVKIAIVATETLEKRARLAFKFGGDPTSFYLADIRLARGGKLDVLPEGQSLTDGNVGIPDANATPETRAELEAFAAGVETAFVRDMIQFLKTDVGVKVPITASQITYHGARIVADTCDYADIHAYWEHPRFPNKPWDSRDWTIANTPMERHPERDALLSRAPWRLLDRPFTLSEWNIPNPNDYAASTVPFAALVAGLQDWDGIFFFTYDNGQDWYSDKLGGYFSFAGQPVKLATLTAFAPVFRRGDIPPLPGVARGSCTQMLPATLGLTRRIGIDPTLKSPDPVPDPIPQPAPDSAAHWMAAEPAHAHVALSEDRVKAAWGLIGGQTLRLGALTARVGGVARDYAVLALVSLDDRPVTTSAHLLLTAVGSAENEGMQWNEARTSVGNHWGKGPARVNGIPAELTLARRDGTPLRVYALDERGGRRGAPLETDSRDAALRWTIGPARRTLWYELVAE